MVDKAKIEQGMRLIIEGIGENPEREGLRETPRRVAEMYEEIFAGLAKDPGEALEVYFTEEDHEEMVLVKDIPLYSMCEHHFLPFFGKAHVVYIPRKGRLTGLSKLAQLVDLAARRPQLQERITSTVADIIMEKLHPHGVVVVLEAEHMCMTMRGVKKPGSVAVTSAVRGIFLRNPSSRAEAFALIQGRKRF
ncbi:MAG: GTP cyclohydrolase I FolE [Firmicutes bacterium]|nr:GTP cyclohydrolase I FolE [Bacillota bacterium]MCL5039614.1 GTP cyclohydrolase I FolE [Bacillota bacterium]